MLPELNLNFPFLNFLSFTLIMLPVCLPKQFFSISGVYSPQISTDCFHFCPHTALCLRQTLFISMISPISQSLWFSPSFVALLWALSSHQDGGVGPQSSQAEALKAPRTTRLGSPQPGQQFSVCA